MARRWVELVAWLLLVMRLLLAVLVRVVALAGPGPVRRVGCPRRAGLVVPAWRVLGLAGLGVVGVRRLRVLGRMLRGVGLGLGPMSPVRPLG
ncbi:hypothetical protein GCM10028799_14070 [Kribbella italica]